MKRNPHPQGLDYAKNVFRDKRSSLFVSDNSKKFNNNDHWQTMVADHMANIEREKYPELVLPEVTLSTPEMTSSTPEVASSTPEMTSSSPEPGKCSDLSDVCDNDSGYSDD